MLAWIFPGQGSQFVGMGKDLRGEAADEVFDSARSILGWDVREVCSRDPEHALSATETAQPAILTVSAAAARSLEARGLFPDLVAGHSLGEISALVAAYATSFEDALRAVAARAQGMGRAGRRQNGEMAAVIGLPADTLEAICARAEGTVVVANVNAPDQVVLSGEPEAVAAASEAARDAGARRVVRLPVSVAAHSPLMTPAAEELSRALEHVTLLPPLVPFVSGVTGRFHEDPTEIKELLCASLTSPVQWPACVGALADAGASLFVEVGPGSVLSGLVRRILPGARVTAICDDVSMARLADELVEHSR